MTCADGPRTRIIATEPASGSSPWETRRAAFVVPADGPRGTWELLVDTARPALADVPLDGDRYALESRSVAVLRLKRDDLVSS